MTHLNLEANPFSAKLKTLQRHKVYQVFDVKKDDWQNYWFKIKDEEDEGWVMNNQCESTSKECFD